MIGECIAGNKRKGDTRHWAWPERPGDDAARGAPPTKQANDRKIKRDTCRRDGPTRPGNDAALGGRSQLEMKLERCHLKMPRTKWCWCSRLGGLRKPILTSPQAQGPREAPEALVAPRESSSSLSGLENACLPESP